MAPGPVIGLSPEPKATDTSAVGVRNRDPIRARIDDEQLLEELGRFLLDLGEQIDMVQEAHRLDQLDEAAERALFLADQADRFGLPPLVAAAQQVADACRRNELDESHKAILALTDVVARIRLGHQVFM